MQYYRFACHYEDPKTGILEGIKDFHKKYYLSIVITQRYQKKTKEKR